MHSSDIKDRVTYAEIEHGNLDSGAPSSDSEWVERVMTEIVAGREDLAGVVPKHQEASFLVAARTRIKKIIGCGIKPAY